MTPDDPLEAAYRALLAERYAPPPTPAPSQRDEAASHRAALRLVWDEDTEDVA